MAFARKLHFPSFLANIFIAHQGVVLGGGALQGWWQWATLHSSESLKAFLRERGQQRMILDVCGELSANGAKNLRKPDPTNVPPSYQILWEIPKNGSQLGVQQKQGHKAR